MRTAIRFMLEIDKDMIRVIEENSPHTIEFRASHILESEFLPDMVAGSLTKRIQEIIAEHRVREG